MFNIYWKGLLRSGWSGICETCFARYLIDACRYLLWFLCLVSLETSDSTLTIPDLKRLWIVNAKGTKHLDEICTKWGSGTMWNHWIVILDLIISIHRNSALHQKISSLEWYWPRSLEDHYTQQLFSTVTLCHWQRAWHVVISSTRHPPSSRPIFHFSTNISPFRIFRVVLTLDLRGNLHLNEKRRKNKKLNPNGPTLSHIDQWQLLVVCLNQKMHWLSPGHKCLGLHLFEQHLHVRLRLASFGALPQDPPQGREEHHPVEGRGGEEVGTLLPQPLEAGSRAAAAGAGAPTLLTAVVTTPFFGRNRWWVT